MMEREVTVVHEEERSIGLTIKSISNLLERRIHSELGPPPGDRATPMQGHIIKFLYENRGHGDLFQRDVEQYLSVRRSTATGILNLMEQSGLIRREGVDYDARLKKLILTDTALDHHRRFSHYIAATEELMAKGITPEALDIFFSVAHQIKRNLEA